jgi:hypothetical protein
MNPTKLYRPTLKVTINGESLDYRPPGIAQLYLVYGFLVKGILANSLSNSAIERMNSKQVLTQAAQKLQELSQLEPEEQIEYFTVLFCSDSVGQYLYPLIEQCFPEIEATRLDGLALLEITTQVITDILENSHEPNSAT